MCGEPQFEDAEVDTPLNPTVLVEVLSPTTADDDRGGKTQAWSIGDLLDFAGMAFLVPRVRRTDDQFRLATQPASSNVTSKDQIC